LDIGAERGNLRASDAVFFRRCNADSTGTDRFAFDVNNRSGVALFCRYGDERRACCGCAAELQLTRQRLWSVGIGESV
jgi:hypothetical protein